MDAESPQPGLQAASVRWGRVAIVVVLVFAALDWVGWATGTESLTRFYPTWPPVTPSGALWVAALGAAIWLQSGNPSPARMWAGRGLTAVLGGFAVVAVAEHAAGRSLGLDQVWFGSAVRAMQSTEPGRPSLQTALSALCLTVAVVLTQVNRRHTGKIWAAFLLLATAVPTLTALAYLFDPPALLKIARSTGMAVATALGLLLLALAAVLVRPDRRPVAWWLAQTNRSTLFRMALIVTGFPLLVGLSRHIFLAFGSGVTAALALSTAVGTVAVGVSMFYLSRHERRLIAANESERALLRANSDGMLDPQALLEAVRDPDGRVVDLVCRSANRALCSYLGMAEQDLVGRSASEDPGNYEDSRLMQRYLRCMEDGEPVILNELPRYSDAHHELRRYDLRVNRVGRDLLSVTWSDVTERFQAAARIREADDRYRRSMENAAIGMCIVTPDDRFEAVNNALCQFLGYDAETLMQKTWKELTAPEYLEADLANIGDISEGRKDSFRLVKQFLHSDGHRVWGDLSVSCVRDGEGRVERFTSQVIDVTEATEANKRNDLLAQRLERERQRLAAELQSAAAYMSSIMPQGLTGKVGVASRYLPSRELGGDCFDYTWIDDDHLLFYLIDVSGHGLEPALLSVSVHNMIRSGSLTTSTLLSPAELLTELNRLFQMDQQSDHYFTMWCGVYEASTRTLRYSGGGAPPALAFNSVDGMVTATELSTESIPLGMFENSVFTSGTYRVEPGCRILIASDGAIEIELEGNRQLSFAGFRILSTRLAQSPDWSLDALIAELHALTPTGFFEDDCSLILLTFPTREQPRPGTRRDGSDSG